MKINQSNKKLLKYDKDTYPSNQLYIHNIQKQTNSFFFSFCISCAFRNCGWRSRTQRKRRVGGERRGPGAGAGAWLFIALKMDHCVWSKGGGAGVGGERKKIILKKKKRIMKQNMKRLKSRRQFHPIQRFGTERFVFGRLVVAILRQILLVFTLRQAGVWTEQRVPATALIEVVFHEILQRWKPARFRQFSPASCIRN